VSFSDPQTITYAGASKTLPRSGQTANESVYRLAESGGVTYTLLLGHQFAGSGAKGRGQRNRMVARLTREGLVSDPLATGQNVPSSMSATLTLDFPILLTAADAQNLANALTGLMTSANVLKLANGET